MPRSPHSAQSSPTTSSLTLSRVLVLLWLPACWLPSVNDAAIPRRRLPPEVRRCRPRHRAQRQQELGPLALRMPHLPAPNLHRVGRPNRASLLLGEGLLP